MHQTGMRALPDQRHGFRLGRRTIRAHALQICGAVALIAASANSAVAQQGFPLVCRGGAGMVATLRAEGELRITFTPTDRGTAAFPPNAGECGFLDRGFRDGEPTVLLYEGDRGGVHFLVDAILNDAPFVVNVFNDNQGAMVITTTRP